jgi:isopentenyl-diphosphate delta-isomerase
MGLDINLKEAFTFRYEAPFDNGLKEHELDHVLIGYTNNNPTINIEEVSDWKWVKMDFISQDLYSNPDIYTIWFKIVFEQFVNHIKKNESNSK